MFTSKENTARCASPIRLLTFAVICLPLLVFVVCSIGCGSTGSKTPEAAVRRFLYSLQAGDWDSYKAAVVVNGTPPSGTNESVARQEFNNSDILFKNLTMETVADGHDTTKATVHLTGGTIGATVDVLGKPTTSSVDVGELDNSKRPLFHTTKFGGVWFVDVAADLKP